MNITNNLKIELEKSLSNYFDEMGGLPGGVEINVGDDPNFNCFSDNLLGIPVKIIETKDPFHRGEFIYTFLVNGHIPIKDWFFSYGRTYIESNVFRVSKFSSSTDGTLIYNLVDHNFNLLLPNFAVSLRESEYFPVFSIRNKGSIYTKILDDTGFVFCDSEKIIKWFDEPDGIIVERESDGLFNVIDFDKHDVACSQWFSAIEPQFEQTGRFDCKSPKTGRWNIIDVNGNILSKIWFDKRPIQVYMSVSSYIFTDYYLVNSYELFNILKPDGNLMFDKWSSNILLGTTNTMEGKRNWQFIMVDKKNKLAKTWDYNQKQIIEDWHKINEQQFINLLRDYTDICDNNFK